MFGKEIQHIRVVPDTVPNLIALYRRRKLGSFVGVKVEGGASLNLG